MFNNSTRIELSLFSFEKITFNLHQRANRAIIFLRGGSTTCSFFLCIFMLSLTINLRSIACKSSNHFLNHHILHTNIPLTTAAFQLQTPWPKRYLFTSSIPTKQRLVFPLEFKQSAVLHWTERTMTTFSSNPASTASEEASQPPAAEEVEDTSASIDIARNMQVVRDKMQAAIAERDTNADKSSSSNNNQSVRLVAVSKTKPIALLQRAYDEAGCRVFGENYVQELVEKVPLLEQHGDEQVQWHYIGALQSNKVNLLLSPFLPTSSSSGENNLHRLIVETVDSIKLARKLNQAIERSLTTTTTAGAASTGNDSDDNTYNDNTKLKVFVQVNTSGESSKSGVSTAITSTDSSSVDDTSMLLVDLCREIVENCPYLHLQGLMTIGAPGDVTAFDSLLQCRDIVQDKLADSISNNSRRQLPLELSMGMSDDYEVAILKGSTNVRVGSSIFGARDYSKE